MSPRFRFFSHKKAQKGRRENLCERCRFCGRHYTACIEKRASI